MEDLKTHLIILLILLALIGSIPLWATREQTKEHTECKRALELELATREQYRYKYENLIKQIENSSTMLGREVWFIDKGARPIAIQKGQITHIHLRYKSLVEYTVEYKGEEYLLLPAQVYLSKKALMEDLVNIVWEK